MGSCFCRSPLHSYRAVIRPRVASRDIHELAAHGKDAVLSQAADVGAINLAVTVPAPPGSSSRKYSIPFEPLSRGLLKTEALEFRGRT